MIVDVITLREVMPVSRFRELFAKERQGTITDTELQEIFNAKAKAMFETCPACSGSFSSFQIRQANNRCPNCENSLKFFTGGTLGHDFHEIDETIEPRGMLGGIWSGWAVSGTIRCAHCSTVYPHKYTCCPQLLVNATILIETGSPENRNAAIKFIDDNSSVLVNSLRGGFASMFEESHRKILERIAPELGCCGELEAVLENT